MSQELIDGRYKLEEEIGDGGMATVFRAWDVQLERPVAVKIGRTNTPLSDREQARFLREARMVAKLRHPNVVSVHDVGVDHARPFLIMELLTGQTLRERLRNGPLPLAEALQLTYRIAGALSAAHAASILHLDVKPENILLEAGGEPKLSDFGISRSLADDATRTQNPAVMGTAAYLAPEQLAGKALDARADVYALGVVLYEMLTGARPFTGESAIAQAAQRLVVEPTPPQVHNASIPASLGDIILQALAREPQARFSSMDAFVEALRRYEHATREPTIGFTQPALDAAPDGPPVEATAHPHPATASRPAPSTRLSPSTGRLGTPAALVGVFLLGSIVTALLMMSVLRNADERALAPADATPLVTATATSGFATVPAAAEATAAPPTALPSPTESAPPTMNPTAPPSGPPAIKPAPPPLQP